MTWRRTAAGAAMIIVFSAVSAHLLAQTQGPGQRRRITSPLNARQLTRLPRTTHSWIKGARDRGRVATDLPMENVILTLTGGPEQQTELEALLADQQNPSSPRFHQWLTPQ